MEGEDTIDRGEYSRQDGDVFDWSDEALGDKRLEKQASGGGLFDWFLGAPSLQEVAVEILYKKTSSPYLRRMRGMIRKASCRLSEICWASFTHIVANSRNTSDHAFHNNFLKTMIPEWKFLTTKRLTFVHLGEPPSPDLQKAFASFGWEGVYVCRGGNFWNAMTQSPTSKAVKMFKKLKLKKDGKGSGSEIPAIPDPENPPDNASGGSTMFVDGDVSDLMFDKLFSVGNNLGPQKSHFVYIKCPLPALPETSPTVEPGRSLLLGDGYFDPRHRSLLPRSKEVLVGATVSDRWQRGLFTLRNALLVALQRIRHGGSLLFVWPGVPEHGVFFFLTHRLRQLFQKFHLLASPEPQSFEVYCFGLGFDAASEKLTALLAWLEQTHRQPGVDDVLLWMLPPRDLLREVQTNQQTWDSLWQSFTQKYAMLYEEVQRPTFVPESVIVPEMVDHATVIDPELKEDLEQRGYQTKGKVVADLNDNEVEVEWPLCAPSGGEPLRETVEKVKVRIDRQLASTAANNAPAESDAGAKRVSTSASPKKSLTGDKRSTRANLKPPKKSLAQDQDMDMLPAPWSPSTSTQSLKTDPSQEVSTQSWKASPSQEEEGKEAKVVSGKKSVIAGANEKPKPAEGQANPKPAGLQAKIGGSQATKSVERLKDEAGKQPRPSSAATPKADVDTAARDDSTEDVPVKEHVDEAAKDRRKTRKKSEDFNSEDFNLNEAAEDKATSRKLGFRQTFLYGNKKHNRDAADELPPPSVPRPASALVKRSDKAKAKPIDKKPKERPKSAPSLQSRLSALPKRRIPPDASRMERPPLALCTSIPIAYCPPHEVLPILRGVDGKMLRGSPKKKERPARFAPPPHYVDVLAVRAVLGDTQWDPGGYVSNKAAEMFLRGARRFAKQQTLLQPDASRPATAPAGCKRENSGSTLTVSPEQQAADTGVAVDLATDSGVAVEASTNLNES